MRKIDERVRDHLIICGFGQFAQAVLRHLGTPPPPVVFVEPDPELVGQLRETGCREVVDPYRLAAQAIVRELTGGLEES